MARRESIGCFRTVSHGLECDFKNLVPIWYHSSRASSKKLRLSIVVAGITS